jgi:hypothetical protein
MVALRGLGHDVDTRAAGNHQRQVRVTLSEIFPP